MQWHLRSLSLLITRHQLRDIFSLHCDTPCVSHDAMRCTCGGNGIAGAGRGTLDADEDQPQNSGPGGFVSATQQATQQEQQVSAPLVRLQ